MPLTALIDSAGPRTTDGKTGSAGLAVVGCAWRRARFPELDLCGQKKINKRSALYF